MRNFVRENRMKIGNLLCRNGLLFAAACLAAIFAARGDTPTPPANDKFKGLEFRELGPALMGGRIDDFAVVQSNPDIVYAGGASRGVLKTTHNRTTPEPGLY